MRGDGGDGGDPGLITSVRYWLSSNEIGSTGSPRTAVGNGGQSLLHRLIQHESLCLHHLHHLIYPHHLPSINLRNSARVRASSRKPPSMLLVTMDTPRL